MITNSVEIPLWSLIHEEKFWLMVIRSRKTDGFFSALSKSDMSFGHLFHVLIMSQDFSSINPAYSTGGVCLRVGKMIENAWNGRAFSILTGKAGGLGRI